MGLIKRLIMAWIAPAVANLIEENARLRGELAAASKEAANLRAECVELEDDKQKLIDFLLSSNAVPTLYSNEPPKVEPKKPNRFAAASSARDFSRIATILENEAFRDDGFQQ